MALNRFRGPARHPYPNLCALVANDVALPLADEAVDGQADTRQDAPDCVIDMSATVRVARRRCTAA
jgi:hypothetical protein